MSKCTEVEFFWWEMYTMSEESIKEGNWVYFAGKKFSEWFDFKAGCYLVLKNPNPDLKEYNLYIQRTFIKAGVNTGALRGTVYLGYHIPLDENIKKITATTCKTLISLGVPAMEHTIAEQLRASIAEDEIELERMRKLLPVDVCEVCGNASCKGDCEPKLVCAACIRGTCDGDCEYILYYDNSDDYKCKRCGTKVSRERHTCPYQSDMHNDKESLCNCCSNCYDNCAGDI